MSASAAFQARVPKLNGCKRSTHSSGCQERVVCQKAKADGAGSLKLRSRFQKLHCSCPFLLPRLATCNLRATPPSQLPIPRPSFRVHGPPLPGRWPAASGALRAAPPGTRHCRAAPQAGAPWPAACLGAPRRQGLVRQAHST